jgi:hypothetical protein
MNPGRLEEIERMKAQVERSHAVEKAKEKCERSDSD